MELKSTSFYIENIIYVVCVSCANVLYKAPLYKFFRLNDIITCRWLAYDKVFHFFMLSVDGIYFLCLWQLGR